MPQRAPPYASFRSSTSHKPHREHGKAPKQLLGVAMRQQLRMPIVLAAAVSLNRCCLPPNATSTPRLTGTQIRDTHCGACVALQAIPTLPIHLEAVKRKTGSRVKNHKSRLNSSYGASASCCRPIILMESAVRPNAREKAQGRGELRRMRLSLGR